MKFTSLFLLLFSAAYTHAGNFTDLRLLRLQGAVKETRERKQLFLYDSNGTDTLSADELTTRFSSTGFKTEELYHEEHSEDSTRTIFVYDEGENDPRPDLYQLMETLLLDAGNRLLKRTHYQTNEDGTVTATDTISFRTGTFSESCDGERHTYWSPAINYLHLRRYNSNGQLLTETYKEDDGKTAEHTKYTYDSRGRLLEAQQTGSHAPAPPYIGKPPVFVKKYRYSADGQEPTNVGYYSEGKHTGTEYFYYRYDSAGNWIYRKVTEKGRIIHITTRNLIYFEPTK